MFGAEKRVVCPLGRCSDPRSGFCAHREGSLSDEVGYVSATRTVLNREGPMCPIRQESAYVSAEGYILSRRAFSVHWEGVLSREVSYVSAGRVFGAAKWIMFPLEGCSEPRSGSYVRWEGVRSREVGYVSTGRVF